MKTFKINDTDYEFVFGVSALQYFYDNPYEYTLINIARKGLEQGAKRAGKKLEKGLDIEAMLDDNEKFFTEVATVESKHATSILVKKTFLEVMTQRQKEAEELQENSN